MAPGEAVTAAVAVGAVAALLGFFAWWRFWFFHRNPERKAPPGEGLLSAADGQVLYREDVSLEHPPADPYHARVKQAFGVAERWSVVATYLSIWDVHVVRSPAAGRVRLFPMAPIGKNLSMGGSYLYAALRRPLPLGKRDYAEKNELLGVMVEGERHVLLVLMADWWIDQIDTWVKDGDTVTRGQPLAKIHMGSQVDVWVPQGARLVSQPGDRVLAGLTVL